MPAIALSSGLSTIPCKSCSPKKREPSHAYSCLCGFTRAFWLSCCRCCFPVTSWTPVTPGHPPTVDVNNNVEFFLTMSAAYFGLGRCYFTMNPCGGVWDHPLSQHPCQWASGLSLSALWIKPQHSHTGGERPDRTSRRKCSLSFCWNFGQHTPPAKAWCVLAAPGTRKATHTPDPGTVA